MADNEENVYSPYKPLQVQNRDQAVDEYCKLEFPSMTADAFAKDQIRSLRHNVARLLTGIVNSDEGISLSIPYIAMNYFDQFISASRNLPNVGTYDTTYRWRILAICCLGLAWKMKSDSFSYKNFMEEKPNLGIDLRDILRVEALILHALKYRLHSITALCFASYFRSLVAEPRFEPNVKEIIIQSQGDIRFTQHKPSAIAASAVLASHYKDPECLKKLVEGRVILDQTEIESCSNLMFNMCKDCFIPFVKRIVSEGESSRGQASAEEAAAELSVPPPDQVEDSYEHRHRPGKEIMKDDDFDPRKEMEDLLNGVLQIQNDPTGKYLRFVILRWMMYKADRYIPLDPSQFPLEPEEEEKVAKPEGQGDKEEKVSKRKSFMKMFACCGKIEKAE